MVLYLHWLIDDTVYKRKKMQNNLVATCINVACDYAVENPYFIFQISINKDHKEA